MPIKIMIKTNMQYPLTSERSNCNANNTKREKYPKKCLSVMFSRSIISISCLLPFDLMFQISPPIPLAIKSKRVEKFKEFKTLKDKLLLSMSMTSLTRIKTNIGTKADKNSEKSFKSFLNLSIYLF